MTRQSTTLAHLLDGPPPPATAQQRAAAIHAALAVAEAVRVAGSVPSGTIYALVCSCLSLAAYTAIINALKGAGLVREDVSHLLHWSGPRLDS